MKFPQDSILFKFIEKLICSSQISYALSEIALFLENMKVVTYLITFSNLLCILSENWKTHWLFHSASLTDLGSRCFGN